MVINVSPFSLALAPPFLPPIFYVLGESPLCAPPSAAVVRAHGCVSVCVGVIDVFLRPGLRLVCLTVVVAS